VPRALGGRRGPLVGLAILVVLLVAGAVVLAGPSDRRPHGASPTTAPATGQRPSAIVVIVSDDQPWNSLHVMPNTQALLARHGVTFTNMFVSNSMCCPSRSTILTGRYSDATGVWRNFPPHGGFDAFRDASTVATWLSPAYRTAMVGKYLNGYGAHMSYVPPGWDRWYAAGSEAYYDYAISDDGHVTRFGHEPQDYSTTVLANEAVRFIDDTSGPLFLYFAPMPPHLPSTPDPRDEGTFTHLRPYRPPSYAEPDVSDKPAYIRAQRWTPQRAAATDAIRQRMYRSLQSVDRAVRDIVEALQRTGRLDDALIVYTSDNGFSLGENRWRGKSVPYDPSIRVPLVIRDDALGLRGGSTDAHLVTNADFAPTFANAAGVAAPGAEGQSLLPLLRGTSSSWRTSFPLEHLLGVHGQANPPPSYCGVRTTRYTYVRYDDGFQEVYDLRADPWELTNVAGEQPELTAKLRALAKRECDPPPPGYRWGS
jgi:N-acetylglucosamine-6-sulfatase